MAKDGSATAIPVNACLGAVLASPSESIGQLLCVIRRHLGMDVGFVSEFRKDERIIRHVDSDNERPVLSVGAAISMDDGLCRKIVQQELPGVIHDASRIAGDLLQRVPFPIGGHLSVPLRLSDGSLYGTFCCFNHAPDSTLTGRDLATLRAFAEIVARQIESCIAKTRENSEKTARVEAVLSSATAPRMVYQPIFGLADLRPIKAEALARFPADPGLTPDRWFAQAADVGFGAELELHAIANALRGFEPIWRRWDLPLGVNVSARTILAGGLSAVLANAPHDKLVIEITEHEEVEAYDRLTEELAPLRASGVRIAVDDAGAGYASMRHVLALRPDIVKLDLGLVRDMDSDPMRRAMGRALVHFAREVGCFCIAEGVETMAELQALRAIGFDAVQGYLLSRPLGSEDLASFLHARDAVTG